MKMDIKEIIKNLELISEVIPDYSAGRGMGLTDDEAEAVVLEAVAKAIDVLGKLQKIRKRNTALAKHYFLLTEELMED